ncbi:hypothetical protein [Leptolyngbya iicbica]|uniref:Uncharacterized protein n=2 Tax=Cyanophyceae TaxID=3028117 RepID=A0A4Q7E4Z4_9CYAN|nr:hypothetical protein [Leptolyngbya sp. LK]RZM77298.1 hypothetical protein DYY88_16785 [Leptolyngbya sp. LK]
MNQRVAYPSRSISPQEQTLYGHLLAYAECAPPEQMLGRFQSLFIDGVGYPDPAVVAALDQILADRGIEEYFHFILNRCCHILINRWQSNPQLQYAVPLLIDLFELTPCENVREYSRSRHVRHLRQVVQNFTETEQYLTLKRLALLVDSDSSQSNDADRPLGNLIQRYPYLYEYCLVSEDSPEAHHQNIRRMQAQAQQKFEVNLSHYVTYRVRQARMKKSQAAPETISRLKPVSNPTLLSDRELVTSLNQFSGKVEHGRSYRDTAHNFLERNQHIAFRDFKRELYDYLSAAVEPGYGKRKFNRMLAEQLERTLPQNEDQPTNDFLLIRTCSQLLNFLVLESSAKPQHFVFIDLINNLGPILTTGLLIKVILLCRKVRPYLEKRFSTLFNHYETSTQNNVKWLVQMFENLNVAMSVNFGSTDISHFLMS